MIDVKATKAAPEQDPAERYVFKSLDKKSNIPFIIGGLVSGIALYVKSLFTEGLARTDAAQAAPDDTDGSQARPNKAQWQVVSSNVNMKSDDDASLDLFQADGSRSSFATRYASGAWLGLIEDAPFDFFKVNLRSNWDVFAISPIIPTPSNDNGPGTAPVTVTPPREGSADGGPSRATEDRKDDDKPNRAPRVTGPVYLMDLVGCGTMIITLTSLLRNAEDPDGDALTIKQITVSSGTLTQSGSEWIYSGPLGPVTITYKITDGQYAVEQTAHFSVLPQPPIYGDDSDNILVGSFCDDQIAGFGGNDNIDGLGGDDIIHGGDGDDHIVGGDGNDIIFGGAGNDVVFGGAGDDQISGGDGNDRLFGDQGDDIMFGDAGDDVIHGGDHNDLLFGGLGDDLIDGGDGDDRIEGGEGDDRLYGGAGADFIDGGAGNDLIDGGDGDDVLLDSPGSDVVIGGAGNDTVIAATDAADDIFDGGEGDDTISYSHATQPLTIDLEQGTAVGVEIGEDTISGFENVVGGQNDDVFIAGSTPTTFTGNGGNDEFVFGRDGSPSNAVVLHEIVDFKPGDLIKMSKWEIFEEVFDENENAFEAIYGNRVDEDDARVRYRRDEHNSIDRTVIEADLNGDNNYEITITLHGNHALLIVESH